MRVILPTLLFTLLVVACNRQPIKTLSADIKQPTLTPETVQSLISSLSSENDDVRKLAEKTSREEAIKQIVIETAPPKK